MFTRTQFTYVISYFSRFLMCLQPRPYGSWKNNCIFNARQLFLRSPHSYSSWNSSTSGKLKFHDRWHLAWVSSVVPRGNFHDPSHEIIVWNWRRHVEHSKWYTFGRELFIKIRLRLRSSSLRHQLIKNTHSFNLIYSRWLLISYLWYLMRVQCY